MKVIKMIKTGLLSLCAVVAVYVPNASAAVDTTGVALDVSPVEAIAAVMLGGLAMIWVARKVVSFLGSR